MKHHEAAQPEGHEANVRFCGLSLLKIPSGGVSDGAVAAGDDSVARLGRPAVRAPLDPVGETSRR